MIFGASAVHQLEQNPTESLGRALIISSQLVFKVMVPGPISLVGKIPLDIAMGFYHPSSYDLHQ